MRTPSRAVDCALAVVALFLVSANTVGLFTTLRNPTIYAEQPGLKRPVLLSEQQFRTIMDGAAQADNKRYAETLTATIHAGMAHYWKDEGIDKYNLRIPFSENYLLFLASFILPGVYKKYEFADHNKALERGVGLCSQQAVVEAEFLKEKGIDSAIIGLGGHVVVQAKVGAKELWVLDPDYGVTLPMSLADIERDPAVIEVYYRRAGYDEATVSTLVGIYGKDRNVVYDGDGAEGYRPRLRKVEKLSYILIWAIPAIIAAVVGARLFLRYRRT